MDEKIPRSKTLLLVIKLSVLALLICVALWHTDVSSLVGFLNVRMLGYALLLQPFAFLTAVMLAKRYAVLLQSPASRDPAFHSFESGNTKDNAGFFLSFFFLFVSSSLCGNISKGMRNVSNNDIYKRDLIVCS